MNGLYFGDNLHVLREHVADASVDLVYLDPPFNSKRDYNILFKSPKGHQSDAQKRVAAARDAAGLEETVQELRERYGPLPKPARRLIWAAELRLVGQAVGLERLDWRADALELTFRSGGAFDPGRVAALLAEGGGRVRMSGERRLARRWEATADEPRFEEAREVVRGLVA